MAALCSICQARPVGAQPRFGEAREARSMGYCTPCFTLAGWENTHSDDGHSDDAPVDNCWACHTELIPLPGSARVGTSRLGVTHSVRRQDTGRDKAKTVATHIVASTSVEKPTVRSYARGTISVRVIHEAGTIRLDWDAEGHFLPTSKIERDGSVRKVRNVSEAYRLLAIAK